jgi:hypothetical protein
MATGNQQETPSQTTTKQSCDLADLTTVLQQFPGPAVSCAALDNSVQPYKSQNQTGKPEIWLTIFDRLCTLKGWNANQKAQVFPLYLRDTALIWYNRQSTTTRENFDDLKKAFCVEFSFSQAQLYNKLSDLTSRSQKPEESIEDYLLDVTQRCQQLGRSEEQELEHMLAGLRPDLKTQVLVQAEMLSKTSLQDIRRIVQLLGHAPARREPPPTPHYNKDASDRDLQLVASLRSELEIVRQSKSKF